MHLITLFRVMIPHQRCLQVKVKYRNEPKQVMPKREDLSRSLEINTTTILYPKWEVVLGAPDRVNIPCLMNDTRLCQLDVTMTHD